MIDLEKYKALRGCSNMRMSKDVGCTHGKISHIISGRNKLSFQDFSTLLNLCNEDGGSIDDLFTSTVSNYFRDISLQNKKDKALSLLLNSMPAETVISLLFLISTKSVRTFDDQVNTTVGLINALSRKI